MDRKLILFVEDDEHDRELYGKLLWYNGFDVAFARTGAEGLDRIEDLRPRLIVLDLQLPDVTGIEVCQRLRADERTSPIPIIILTGRPRREFAAWAETMGCAGFLEKPVTPLEVLREVERVIGRAPLPGDIVAAEREQQLRTGIIRTPTLFGEGAGARNPFERLAAEDATAEQPPTGGEAERPASSRPEADAPDDPRRPPEEGMDAALRTEPPMP
jgi:two-component system, cell cycle response regulator DivK